MHRTKAVGFRGRRLECRSVSCSPAPPPSGSRPLAAPPAQTEYRRRHCRRLVALALRAQLQRQLTLPEVPALAPVLPPALVPAPELGPNRSACALRSPPANSSARSCPCHHQ